MITERLMDKDRIVALLNQDLKGEHAAIIQYLFHAYAMSEGKIACEIEAIVEKKCAISIGLQKT